MEDPLQVLIITCSDWTRLWRKVAWPLRFKQFSKDKGKIHCWWFECSYSGYRKGCSGLSICTGDKGSEVEWCLQSIEQDCSIKSWIGWPGSTKSQWTWPEKSIRIYHEPANHSAQGSCCSWEDCSSCPSFHWSFGAWACDSQVAGRLLDSSNPRSGSLSP